MLIRFLQEWCNFAPPAEADLDKPVADILIERGIAELKADAPDKKPKPRKDKRNGNDA